MTLPCYHIVYYKNHAIYYVNGLYKIGDIPSLTFINMNDAKNRVDEYELLNNKQLFDNQKVPNDKTNVGD